jgi:glycerol uptake facilitator-like aquaporin
MNFTLRSRAAAEFLGTAFLLAAVVGSGIMGERLAGGNVATVAAGATRGLPWHDVPAYLLAQISGAFAGVAAAHLMFGLPLFSVSSHARHGRAQLGSEIVATFGLLFVVWGCTRFRPSATAYAVGAYITAAYWFTSSTSFANPAVTLARSVSDTFAGIRPGDAPGFILAQVTGTAAALLLCRLLVPDAAAQGEVSVQSEDSAAVKW